MGDAPARSDGGASVRYRTVPLEEVAALEHSIRLHRNALVAHAPLVTEVLRTKNHKALGWLRRVEDRLILLAGEVEGQGIRMYGSEAFNALERRHLEGCDSWRSRPPWPVPFCDLSKD